LTSVTVKDTGNESHTIAKIKSGGTDIAVFSKDTFNLSDADKTLLPNFGRIKKGITLVSTDNDNGITTTASGTVIWGTATSAQRLVDIEDSSVFYDITDFVLKASPTFTTPVTFNTGFILGSVPRAAAEIANGADLLFRTYSTDSKIILLPAGSASTGVLQIDSESVIPSSGVSLGSNADRFYQIFADNIAGTSVVGAFFGNLTGNVTGNLVGNVTGNLTGNVTGNLTGNVTGNASSATNASRLNNTEASDSATNSTVALRTASGNLVANQFVGTTDKADRIKIDNSASDNPASAYKTAMTTQTPLTIAARDSSGDITARIFRGTATAVQAADLAEKYLADKEYDVGTVVIVGGEQEVTASVWVGQRAVGVVSAAPGLMMNQDLEGGTYIALKGRVPVRVIGQVRKGDRLVAAPDGCAMASEDANANTFAVALESSLNTEVKLIEAIVL
jgi:outer membrane lipoprotein SlyB